MGYFGWVGSLKMDPRTTLASSETEAPITDSLSVECFFEAFAAKINRVPSVTTAAPEPSSYAACYAQLNASQPVDPLFDVRRFIKPNAQQKTELNSTGLDRSIQLS